MIPRGTRLRSATISHLKYYETFYSNGINMIHRRAADPPAIAWHWRAGNAEGKTSFANSVPRMSDLSGRLVGSKPDLLGRS